MMPIEKLRGIRHMLDELTDATDDRFTDVRELGAAVALLSPERGAIVRRLGLIVEYLAQDGGTEILAKIDEISERIDGLITQMEGGSE